MLKQLPAIALLALACGGPDKPAETPTESTTETPVADPVLKEMPQGSDSMIQPPEDVFQWAFAEAIDKDDVAMWRKLLSARMAGKLDEAGVERHFTNWKSEFKPLVAKLREAKMAVDERGERSTIRFVGVTSPGGSDEVAVTVALEQGVYKIDEN